MGRFYTPVQAEFTDNFIYQPPWELAIAALSTKEDQIQGQLDNINFLQNIPIDFYKDYDKDYVKKLREELEDDVDQIVQGMRKDIMNPEYGRQLARLQKDVLKRFETGDFSNVLQSAENYRKFEERLSKMSPYEQEMIKKNLLNPLVEEAGGFGSAKKVFDPGVLQSHRTLNQEFIKYMVDTGYIKPSQIETASSGPGGDGYIYTVKTGEGGLTEEQLEEAFKAWVASLGDLKSYDNFARKVYNQSYFDENGNLDWSQGSTLDKDLEFVKKGAYKIHAEDRSTSPDQTYMWKQERAEQSLLSAALEPTKKVDVTPTDVADTFTVPLRDEQGRVIPGKYITYSLRGLRRDALKDLVISNFGEEFLTKKVDPIINNRYEGSYSEFLTAIGSGKMSAESLVKYVNLVDPDNPVTVQQMQTLINKAKEADEYYRFKATWAPFFIGLTPAQQTALKANTERLASQNNYAFSLGTTSGSGHSTQSKRSFSDWANPAYFNEVKKILNLPENADSIKSITYKKNSATPFGFPDIMVGQQVADFPTQIGVEIVYYTDKGAQKTTYANGYTDPGTLTVAGDHTSF